MSPQQEQQLRQQAKLRGYDEAKTNAYVDFVRNKTASQIEASRPVASAPKQQQGDGFIKSLAKDAFKTLIVKPGARIGQAAAYGLGAITKDENLKNAAFEDTNINLGLLGNYDIEGQRGGVSGVKQVVGDAAKTASYLYTPGKAASVIKGGFSGAVKQSALQGAKAGAIGGGLYGGGQAAIDDKSGGEIVKDTLTGAAAGGVAGGVLGAGVPLAVKGAQKTAGAIKAAAKINPLSSESRIIVKRTNELTKLENSNSKLRSLSANSSGKGIDVKKLLAETDLLHNAVDDTGTIRTQNALTDLQDFIKPQESIISRSLHKEGKKLPLGIVESHLKKAVNDSGLKGGAKIRALKNVADDIEGYALEVDKDGYIPLALLQDAKIDKYSNINFLNPETKRADKAIARGLKELVETHTTSVDVKQLNDELAQWFSLEKYLEALDGKKVDGGKLGKYFAQTLGGIAGSHFGPLGTVAGAEIAGRIRGATMKSKFGSKIGRNLEQSPAMQSAIEKAADKVIELPQSNIPGTRNMSQATNTTAPTTAKTIPSVLSKVNDTLNEVTPGLSIQNPKIQNLQTEWRRLQKAKNNSVNTFAIARYEKAQKAIEKEVDKIIKTLGVLGIAGGVKAGSDKRTVARPQK